MKQFDAMCLLITLLAISGCEMLPGRGSPAEVLSVQPEICLFEPPVQDFEHNCDVVYWLQQWTDATQLSWSERKERIQLLGDSSDDVLRKILLSQGANTPYQDRLRAQAWMEAILVQMTPQANALLSTVLRQPAQDLLEFESALAVMTRINAKQESQIKQQQQELETKQGQIEQLLTIEASMIDDEQEKP